MVTGQLELRWLASSSASALRGAWLVANGRALTDAALEQQLAMSAQQLQHTIGSLPARADIIWRHLLPLSTGIESNRELAEVTLRKSCGASAAAHHGQRLAESVAEVERVFRAQYPTAADDLGLRGKPLREQWEARGPGLLRHLADLTERELLVERSDVVLVQPTSGGGGEPYLAYNLVLLEALLTNCISDLPEIARLAWLLAQLNLDLPHFSERVSPARLPHIAGLALVPAILRAAQHVELTAFNEDILRRAIHAWHSPLLTEDVTMIVWDWWATYEVSKPSFAIALQGLDKMLECSDK